MAHAHRAVPPVLGGAPRTPRTHPHTDVRRTSPQTQMPLTATTAQGPDVLNTSASHLVLN